MAYTHLLIIGIAYSHFLNPLDAYEISVVEVYAISIKSDGTDQNVYIKM